MPVLTTPDAATGSAAHPALFGGNVLAPRAHMMGPGSYAEAIEQLGVTGLRYPGGSLTEKMFSLRDPDAARVFSPDLGREVDFIPLSGIMDYAEQTSADRDGHWVRELLDDYVPATAGLAAAQHQP